MEKTKIYESQDAGLLKNTLQREFIRRCKKNPSYSLRAYAQYLEIDQSFLSKLFNGGRKVTTAMELKLAEKLGRPMLKTAKLSVEKKIKNEHFIKLSEDEYEIISSWYHFAILELIKTKGFKPDLQNVAHYLGIHSEEVRDAINRLVRLGFVKVTKTKWNLISKNHIWTNPEVTSPARRTLQIELNKKALDALENTPFSLRENGSLAVAVDSRRLPEFKQKVSQVLNELSEFMQPTSSNLDSVYQLTISLFPISKKNLKEIRSEKI